jgi:MFS family permease
LPSVRTGDSSFVTAGSWRERYLGALGERDFRLLFLGRIISSVGDKVFPVAIAFAVLELTHSASDLGLILGARVFAMVALLLAGGIWSDRLSRRNVLIGTDLLRFVSQGATAVLLLAGWATVWELVLLQVAAGAGQGFFRPASTGLVPETVSPERLQQANALLGISQNGSTLLGPALAGVLVAGVGAGWAVGLDALSFLASAAFLVRLPLDRGAERIEQESFVADLAAGWNEFRSRTWLVTLVGGFSLFHLVVFAPFFVLGPLVAEQSLGGAPAWAAIMVAFGAGALVGGGLGLRLRPDRPLLWVDVAFVPQALPLAALALRAPTWAIAATAAVSGAAGGYGSAVWETTLQQRIPKHVLSRVSSYDWLGSMAFLPLGYAIVGPLADAFGVEGVLWAGAVAMAAAALAALAARDVRAPDEAEPPEPPAPAAVPRVARERVREHAGR